MSLQQLEAASRLLATIQVSTQQNLINMEVVRQTFMNHVQRCIRIPRGGANAGGSMQTGFDMELLSADGASQLLAGWPNHQTNASGTVHSWEIRNMQDMAIHMAFERKPAGWGALQGRPMAALPGSVVHPGVILVASPFTVSWVSRPDHTTLLTARFPLVLWSEEDAVILPPDDAHGVPFYQDPANNPGAHRDMFKTWGRRVAGELVSRGFQMSDRVLSHLPREYQSDSEGSQQSSPPPSPRSP